jgi:hypothetical protein
MILAQDPTAVSLESIMETMHRIGKLFLENTCGCSFNSNPLQDSRRI